MSRITPIQKKIVDAHIEAKKLNVYSDAPYDGSLQELKRLLLEGKTFRFVFETIETRYCSVGSQLLASGLIFEHMSRNYKTGINKGFKLFLNNLNIR